MIKIKDLKEEEVYKFFKNQYAPNQSILLAMNVGDARGMLVNLEGQIEENQAFEIYRYDDPKEAVLTGVGPQEIIYLQPFAGKDPENGIDIVFNPFLLITGGKS